jgi:hypothetical protein
MHNTTAELVVIAEETAFNTPDQERFAELQSELQDSPWLNEVEEREELIEALSHITVSDAVRKACEQDMRDGQRNNWRTR